MKIKVLRTTLGDDDCIYNTGSVIDIHEHRGAFFVAMGDANIADKDAHITPKPTPPPPRASVEAKAMAEAIKVSVKEGREELKREREEEARLAAEMEKAERMGKK